MPLYESPLSIQRRTILKALGLGTLAGVTGGCDAVGSVFGRDVVFRGIDGYDDSIPFKRAMQDDVMLAFLMNGEKLPKEHGFPIRLLVPGLYGIKNVKWIVEIEVYPGDYQGYWQRKGWTDDGTIKIFSRIDSPGHYQTLRGQDQLFRGIAFGGPNSISKVELSFDAGRTCNECEIEKPMSPYSWVIW